MTTYAVQSTDAFDGAHGSQPLDGLVADADGNLYGTPVGGGTLPAITSEGVSRGLPAPAWSSRP